MPCEDRDIQKDSRVRMGNKTEVILLLIVRGN